VIVHPPLKPNIKLAETRMPDGARLTLHSHDGSFCIRIDGRDLMHSMTAASELLLGDLATAPFPAGAAPRVLIGGLGLGFTLKRVLEKTGPKAVVHVAELMPEVVEWNRTFLADLNGRLLQSPRVKVLVEDVLVSLERAAQTPYDAILLDVDNGPAAMVLPGNTRLYDNRGLTRLWHAVKPGGRIALWSAGIDRAFARRFAQAGFKVEAVPARLHANSKSSTYLIYVADKPAAAVPRPKAR
jgi:spermidine synthase